MFGPARNEWERVESKGFGGGTLALGSAPFQIQPLPTLRSDLKPDRHPAKVTCSRPSPSSGTCRDRWSGLKSNRPARIASPSPEISIWTMICTNVMHPCFPVRSTTIMSSCDFLVQVPDDDFRSDRIGPDRRIRNRTGSSGCGTELK